MIFFKVILVVSIIRKKWVIVIVSIIHCLSIVLSSVDIVVAPVQLYRSYRILILVVITIIRALTITLFYLMTLTDKQVN